MTLFRLFIAIVLVAACGLIYVWTKMPDLVAESLSKKMQVPVKIADINVAYGAIKIEKLEIGNPQGSLLPKAFSADSIQVAAPLTNYIKKQIVIDQIEIKQIYLGVEIGASTSSFGNWATILSNLQSSSPKDTASKGKREGSLLIKKLILTNITTEIISNPLTGNVQKLKPIDRLEFDNVSSNEGISLDQIAKLVLQQTLNSVLTKHNLQNMLKDVMQSPSGTWQKLSEPFKELLQKQN